MTKTIMTKEEIKLNYRPSDNLGSLFAAIEESFLKKGEVVCQFKLNGMTLSESDEKRLSLIGLDEVEIVEIESEHPEALLMNLIDNWVLELPLLIQNTDSLAAEIKFKGIEGHLKPFVDLVESCQFLVESLLHLECFVKAQIPDISRWRKTEEMAARAIGDALNAFEKKDFVQLAEVLEYDLGNSLQNWWEQIKFIQIAVKDDGNTDNANDSSSNKSVSTKTSANTAD